MSDPAVFLVGLGFLFIVVGAMILPVFKIRNHIAEMKQYHFVPGFFIYEARKSSNIDEIDGFGRDDRWKAR